MKAKLLMTLMLAGEALAAELPAPFHHVRLATFQADTAPAPTPLPKSWLKGPTAVEVGATKRINKHFEYSWTTMRQGANDRFFYQPGNAAQQWTSAAKIEFRF